MKKHYCMDCGNQISRDDALRCKSCARKGELNPNFGSHTFHGQPKINGKGKDSNSFIDGRTLTKHYCIDVKVVI
jgi:hypothetical protein